MSNYGRHPPDRLTKRGQRGGAENVERLREYVERLKAEGRSIPSRAGKPDKSAVARECGFNRQTLYPENNSEAAALLARAVEEVGLEKGSERAAGSAPKRVEHLEQRASREERRSRQLEDRLQVCEAEKLDLRLKIQSLEEQLRRYRHLEEVMITSGRRFRP